MIQKLTVQYGLVSTVVEDKISIIIKKIITNDCFSYVTLEEKIMFQLILF